MGNDKRRLIEKLMDDGITFNQMGPCPGDADGGVVALHLVHVALCVADEYLEEMRGAGANTATPEAVVLDLAVSQGKAFALDHGREPPKLIGDFGEAAVAYCKRDKQIRINLPWGASVHVTPTDEDFRLRTRPDPPADEHGCRGLEMGPYQPPELKRRK